MQPPHQGSPQALLAGSWTLFARHFGSHVPDTHSRAGSRHTAGQGVSARGGGPVQYVVTQAWHPGCSGWARDTRSGQQALPPLCSGSTWPQPHMRNRSQRSPSAHNLRSRRSMPKQLRTCVVCLLTASSLVCAGRGRDRLGARGAVGRASAASAVLGLPCALPARGDSGVFVSLTHQAKACMCAAQQVWWQTLSRLLQF